MTFSIARHRRRAAAVALPLTATLLLAACGGGDSGADSKTITLAYATANNTEQAYEVLAKDYMAAHPGTTVKTTRIALNAYNQTISTQLQAGNAPDVLYMNSGTGQTVSVGQLSKANHLLELDKSVAAGIPEAQLDGYEFDGKLYGLPTSITISGIVYNDELAKQNGVTITPTTTLEEVLSQCGKVAATGKSIFGLAGSIPENNGILALEIASSTVYGPTPDWNQQRADGKVTFANTQGWKDALQAVKDLNDAKCFQKGAAGAGFDALTNGAAQGKLFGFFAPSGATKDIMDGAKGRVKLVALPFPGPAATPTQMSVANNLGLSGNKKTKNPDLVKDFLKYAVSPEASKKFAQSQGSMPIGKVATADLLPQYQPVADLLAKEQYRPFGVDSWKSPQVYPALGSGLTGLLTGQKTVDDVLKAMDSAWG
ncbi:ABC transporter substrate-binding protein [Cryptosporangium japonicum]|uniref:Sugar ABC transporter substrate-binding protein n=1 Tax=Cryptosporangium japonicum TaxID=80872 RepID=A0ABP3E410_9ACTN